MNRFVLKSNLIPNKPDHSNDVYNACLNHNFALWGPIPVHDGPYVTYGTNLHTDDGS